MITTIYAIHAPDPRHLTEVKAEMQRRGSPVLRVVDCGDHYMALEGSHRLAAAHCLDIAPTLIVYGQDDLIEIGDLDWFVRDQFAADRYSGGEIAAEIFSPHQAVPYSFDRIEITDVP
jgi:hypothetical protein